MKIEVTGPATWSVVDLGLCRVNEFFVGPYLGFPLVFSAVTPHFASSSPEARTSLPRTSEAMSIFSVMVALSLIFVSSIKAEACTEEQLRTIAQNSNLPACSKFMGISEIFSFTSLTDGQMRLFCTSPDCMAMWEELNTLGYGDCTFGGIDVAFQSEILDRVPKVCGVSLPSTGSSGSSISSDVVSDNESSSLRSSSSTTSVETLAVVFIAATFAFSLL